MDAMAPGIRRFGKFLRWTGATAIADMSTERIERIQVRRKRNFLTSLLTGSAHPDVRSHDQAIAGSAGDIPVRIYTPRRALEAGRPLVVNIHGGGWVLGDLNGADWLCSHVAYGVDAVVVSVDYRLAPRHRFPAAVDDCWAALVWATRHADQIGATNGRIGVMGESAGGNLAAVMGLLARDRGGPVLHHQTLIYPATDLAGETESRRRNREALVLTEKDMNAFRDHYLGPDGDRTDWRASPLRAATHEALPPALIQVAAHDPLLDDGVRYAQALENAGVPVKLSCYSAMPHGFLNFPRFSRDAPQALAEIILAQKVALNPEAAVEM